MHVCDPQPILVVVSVLRPRVPDSERWQLAMQLLQFNYQLALGAWEMAPDGEELRFRTSVDFRGITPAAGPCRCTLDANLAVFERQATKLLAMWDRPLDPAAGFISRGEDRRAH